MSSIMTTHKKGPHKGHKINIVHVKGERTWDGRWEEIKFERCFTCLVDHPKDHGLISFEQIEHRELRPDLFCLRASPYER